MKNTCSLWMLLLLFLGVVNTSVAQDDLVAFKQFQFALEDKPGGKTVYLIHDLETHTLSLLADGNNSERSKFILKRDSRGNTFIVSMVNGAFFLHYDASANKVSFKEYKSGDAKDPFVWNLLLGSAKEKSSLISPFLDDTKGLKIEGNNIVLDTFKDSSGASASSSSKVSSAYVFIKDEINIKKI
jgi:hypothetical protein